MRAVSCALLFAACFATCFAAGCSKSKTEPTPPDAGPGDANEPQVPAESCVQPGDVGNAQGVGTFCSPGGGQCMPFPLAGVCLAGISQAGDRWFCTRFCENDMQCGPNAECRGDSRGAACVPTRCLEHPHMDGGTPTDDAQAPPDGELPADAAASPDVIAPADASDVQ